MHQLRPRALADWLADPGRPAPRLIDVREDWEFAFCHIAGAEHLPMHRIPGSLDALDPAAPVVLICHHGIRSQQVAHFLEHHGFTGVHNLMGGVAGWAEEVDPDMPRY